MISFLGIDFQSERVNTLALGRDLSVGGRADAAIAGGVEEAGTGILSIPSAEWLRAGGFALQELYSRLPLDSRKIWGIGISGPDGWVALDPDFEPLSDVRLIPGSRILDDLRQWLSENPRMENRVSLVLSPKDFFRFKMCGSMATDATSVCSMDLFCPQRCDWDRKKLAATGLPEKWFPPVFRSSGPTGRLNKDGMRQCGLPGSLWLVAGATSRMAAMIPSGDLRSKKIWAPDDGQAPVYAIGHERDHPDPVVPAGYLLCSSAINDHLVLLRKEKDPADPAAPEMRVEIENSSYTVLDTTTRLADSELGAAVLAAFGSGLFNSWDRYYTLLARKESAEEIRDPDPPDR
ncbi:MAG: FGGY family carbohydrate kinase [Planctomycetota bacterium]